MRVKAAELERHLVENILFGASENLIATYLKHNGYGIKYIKDENAYYAYKVIDKGIIITETLRVRLFLNKAKQLKRIDIEVLRTGP